MNITEAMNTLDELERKLNTLDELERKQDAIDRLIERIYTKTSGWKIIFRPLYWEKIKRLHIQWLRLENEFNQVYDHGGY